MPLPMVHLGVARNVALSNSKLINDSLYYLGSIAPDAIHSRIGSSKIDKCRAHIRSKDDTWYDDIFKFTLKHKNGKGEVQPFYIGYMIHILTDLLWEDSIHSKVRMMMDRDNIEKNKQSSIYYNETDQLDFKLFKFYSWRNEVWCLLEKAYALDVDELLTKEEINKWRVRTLHWYDLEVSKHSDPIKYLNFNILNDFINSAAAKIIGMIADIPI